MTEFNAKVKAREDIKKWVNKKTECQFEYSPVHFASYHGVYDVLKLLEKYGANLLVANNAGLTGIHIAAWQDHAWTLTFLQSRALSVDQPDMDGQTALHWACYHASEEALYYLLAWTKDINHQDNNG